MDTQLSYTKIIKKLLQDHAQERSAMPDSYESYVIFDDAHKRYIVIDSGWQDDYYLHTTPLHIDIIDRLIWIQCDDTEDGIADELIRAGIPKEKIVLGFRHPDVRPHTGFGPSSIDTIQESVPA